MNPQIGDIWEWTAERWDHDKKKYYDFKYVILILTEPEQHYQNDSQGWDFEALELDGDAMSMVDRWTMYHDDSHDWRQLA